MSKTKKDDKVKELGEMKEAEERIKKVDRKLRRLNLELQLFQGRKRGHNQ